MSHPHDILLVMENNELHTSKWRRFGGRHNACLQLTKSGQFEIIGHIANKHDIDDFCNELAITFKLEWSIKETKQLRKIKALPNDELLFRNNKIGNNQVISFNQIPELKPEPIFIKEPA